jgi:hypothetical protein
MLIVSAMIIYTSVKQQLASLQTLTGKQAVNMEIHRGRRDCALA